MPRLALADVQVLGTKEVVQALRELGLEAPRALATALYQEAETMMTEAKVLTPVDTGNLRASGHVNQPVVEGPVVSIALGFGGPAGTGNQGGSNAQDVGYAVYVHERVELHHPVGQAKFLETAAKNRSTGMSERVARHLRGTLQRIRNRGTAR